MARPIKLVTKPCEFCGASLTKTGKEAAARKYWTCGAECSHKLRIQLGKVAASWQPNRYRGQVETRSCARCGKPVTRYVNEQNHDAEWFCGRKCSVTTRNERPREGKGDIIPCETCGTPFYRMPREVRAGRRFCKRECADEGHTLPLVKVPCAYCGEEMLLQPSVAETRRYCSREHWMLGKVKRPTGRVHNGKPVRVMPDGYVKIWEPEHPRANRGWIPEHLYIMEQHLGRPIGRDEEVDHQNRVRGDNRVANLQVFTKGDHRKKTWDDRRAERAALERDAKQKAKAEQRVKELEEELVRLRAQLTASVLS